MIAKIKTGLSGLNATELVAKSKGLVRSLTGNANFPTPEPALADITVKQEQLLDLIADVENRERNAVNLRNACAKELVAMLNKLAAYVTMTGNEDARILETSGFEMYKTPEPVGPLMPPLRFLASRTTHKGQVELTWAHVKGSKSYQIQMTTGDPAAANTVWTTEKVTATNKALIDNLTPGVTYSFRAMAINTADESEYSDAAIIMAA